jgi:hypothetical protein
MTDKTFGLPYYKASEVKLGRDKQGMLNLLVAPVYYPDGTVKQQNIARGLTHRLLAMQEMILKTEPDLDGIFIYVEECPV